MTSATIIPALLLRPAASSDRAEFVRVMSLSADHFREWFPERDPAESFDAWFDRELDKAAACAAASNGLRRFVFAKPDLAPTAPPTPAPQLSPSAAPVPDAPPRLHPDSRDAQVPRAAIASAPPSIPASFPAHLDSASFTRLVGFVNLSNIVRGAAHFADIGWSVSADATRRGVATSMVNFMLTIAFAPPSAPSHTCATSSSTLPSQLLAEPPSPVSAAGALPPGAGAGEGGGGGGLGLHRVQCAIIPRNLPSIRVAESCGFTREGLARQYLRINGSWQDHAIFSLLSHEHAARATSR